MYTSLIYFLYAGTVLFHSYSCQGQLHTILNNEDLIRSENQVKKFVNLLKRIHLEVQYDYIVLVEDDVAKKSACIFEDSIAHVNKPIVVVEYLTDPNSQHSNNFLLLTCSLDYLNQFKILNGVYQYAPHIIWLEEHTEMEMNQQMNKLCSNIHKSGYFKNLIVTPQSLNLEANYSSCDFQKQIKPVNHKLFANPFQNLQGLTIVTESDLLPPRSFLFYDHFGRLKLTGFVANCLTTFATRHNASLLIVPPSNESLTIHTSVLVNKTFRGLLDIAAVTAPVPLDSASALDFYSYPIELMEYCYMIPLPHIRPFYHVYFDIIEVKALLIILACVIIFAVLLNIGQDRSLKHLDFSSVVLNDKSIRGLLGQSFVMPRKTSLFLKYILVLVCYSSILLTTSYDAYLQSHLVNPSLEKRMETYDDMRRNNYKILLLDRENFIPRTTLERYRGVFDKTKTLNKILNLRDNMDTRYIYPVSYSRWCVFNERQKLFQRKLFYYSSQLCLRNLVFMSFPLRPGLPYKFHFNQHLLDVRDSGLLDCWLKRNFLNMVRLKLISFEDLSVADKYGPQLELNDFLWIWILYAASMLISSMVFIGEVVWNKMCLL